MGFGGVEGGEGCRMRWLPGGRGKLLLGVGGTDGGTGGTDGDEGTTHGVRLELDPS